MASCWAIIWENIVTASYQWVRRAVGSLGTGVLTNLWMSSCRPLVKGMGKMVVSLAASHTGPGT